MLATAAAAMSVPQSPGGPHAPASGDMPYCLMGRLVMISMSAMLAMGSASNPA